MSTHPAMDELLMLATELSRVSRAHYQGKLADMAEAARIIDTPNPYPEEPTHE